LKLLKLKKKIGLPHNYKKQLNMKRLLSTLFLFTSMVSCDNQPQEEFKLESSLERLISNEEIEKIGSYTTSF